MTAPAASGPRFAVLDLETTGFAYAQHHRVVEVAVVLLDERLAVEGRWQTLVNPQRDIGATHVHGIRARDLVDAPEFVDIADELGDVLAGRVVVAHNAPFDTGFLRAEFARVGAGELDFLPHSLCTMRWAPTVFPAATRKLEACCAAAGVRLEAAHSALGDATATAALFAAMAAHPTIADAARARLPYRHLGTRVGGTRRPLRPRTAPSTAVARDASWMSRIAATMPRLPVGPAEECYLAVLDRALEDRLLSGAEAAELVGVATALHLDRASVAGLHGRYLTEMAAVAWADGIVTDAERDDLCRVARELGFSDEDAVRLGSVPGERVATAADGTRADEPAPSDEPASSEVEAVRVALRPGDRVTFTGDMAVPREEWERRAREKGLDVGGVTKKSALVVAADAYSFSGKAKKARDYGVPIVEEAVFARLLGEMR